MTANPIGSGIGGALVGAQQTTYGGDVSLGSARTFGTFKSFKPTINPHPYQGGPYLRNGEIFDLGTTRLLLWEDATATMTGDMATIGQGLLVATALGSADTMTQLGTTTAYELGGSGGTTAGAPDANSTFADLQALVNTAPDSSVSATYPQTYHSGIITKATWTFDRLSLVSYEYTWDFQYMESTTDAATPSEPAGPIGFTMFTGSGGNTSQFLVGPLGSEVAITGVRKFTISLERKMNVDRMYVGQQYKDMPVTNDKAQIMITAEADYTALAKTDLFDLWLAGNPFSVICKAVGPEIGSSGYYNTFSLNATNCFIDTGGEAPLDGPDIIKNTLNIRGTIDASNDAALKCILISSDTAF